MLPLRALLALSAAATSAAAAVLLLRDQTTDSDETGETVSGVPVPRGGASLGLRAVEVLSRHLGERGEGKKGTPGYHRSPFIDRVNRGIHGDAPRLVGVPWCARAVRYACEVAAQELGLPPPFAGMGALASVSNWKGAAFRPYFLAAPKVGAVLLLGDQHATLVAQALGDGKVVTIEGNHGDAVANVKRTLRPQDTLVDVESFVAARRGAVVGSGLDLLGVGPWQNMEVWS